MNTEIYKKSLNTLSVFAFLLSIGFLLSSIFIHLTNPAIDFFRYPLSVYLLTQNGIILKIGFFMIGLAELIIAFNLLYINTSKYKLSALGLIIAGISVILVALFPMDIKPEMSFQGTVHIYAAAVFFIFSSISIFLYGLKVPNKKLCTYSISTGIISAVLFIIITIFLYFEDPLFLNYYGLLQKINILIIVLWFIVISVSMMKQFYNKSK